MNTVHICPHCKSRGRVTKYKKVYRVVQCRAGHKWHQDKFGNDVQVRRGRPKFQKSEQPKIQEANMNAIAEQSISSLTAQHILRVFARNAEHADSPEGKLWLEVLGQALRDGKKCGGYRFYASNEHKQICDAIGLNYEMASEIALAWMDSQPVKHASFA